MVRIGHTSKYQYIQKIYTVHHHTSFVFGIRFNPPCTADESQMHAGAVHHCQLASFIQSPQLRDQPGVASSCHTQIATATHLPHRHCCHACCPPLLRQRSPSGNRNPCTCCTCATSRSQRLSIHRPRHGHAGYCWAEQESSRCLAALSCRLYLETPTPPAGSPQSTQLTS